MRTKTIQLDMPDELRKRFDNGIGLPVYQREDGTYIVIEPEKFSHDNRIVGVVMDQPKRRPDGTYDVIIAVQGWVSDLTSPNKPYYCKPGDPPAKLNII